MLRTSCKLFYTFKIKKNLWVQRATCSTVMKSNIENNPLHFPKHELKILQLVNTSKLNKLTQFISASYAETLISMRTSNGPYKSLNDVLLKTEIDVDSWNKFCTSVIKYHTKHKWKKFVKHDIYTTTAQMPAKILGINVGPTAITWTLIDCNFNVLVWDSRIWWSNSLEYDIINSVPLLVQQLPLSNSYVMEELKVNKKSHASLIMQYQIANSIGSCIKLLINQRTNNSNSSTDILYILKSLTTARFFNLLIVSEVIATECIIEQILDDTKKDNEWLRDIRVGYELKQKYMQKDAIEREQMGRSLLTTLACLHIIRSCIV
ncbi:uncharacterized protein LOC132908527 [Bombus pascuorum]|uniref:uncharacterized protein LOC132908527 n=1 Tax=Bombus pascuorum TaxID=65598 RepID=UPI0021414389|nr:uncharacterized protein LOC132908527 [Bombus pascuorum]